MAGVTPGGAPSTSVRRATIGESRTTWLVGGAAAAVAAAIVVLHLLNRGSPTFGLLTYTLNQAEACFAYGVLGALVLRRHPRHPIGWLLVAAGLTTGLGGLCNEYVVLGVDGAGTAALPLASWAAWGGSFLWMPNYELFVPLLLVLAPDGHPRRLVGWVLGVVAVAIAAVDLFWAALSPFDDDALALGLHHPLGITGEAQRIEDVLTWIPTLAIVMLVLILLFHFSAVIDAKGIERRRFLWITVGAVLLLVFQTYDSFADVSSDRPWLEALFITLPPIGAAVAIVRHNLFDLDRVLHRGIAALAFSGAAGGVFAATVLFVERVTGPTSLTTSAIGVGVLAAAALPLWRAVDAIVRRGLFGDRADPIAVLDKVGSSLDAVASPTDAFAEAAGALRAALKVPLVAVEVGDLRVIDGDASVKVESFPLVGRDQLLGHLRVGTRSDREPFTAEERGLLRDLARRLAAAADVSVLTDDLVRSRARLVTGREEERRRLRHDLHDSLGPQLAGIGLQLDMARELLHDDPDHVDQLLVRAKSELSGAIVAIRTVVDGLRPPALDELGLKGALDQQASLLDGRRVGGTGCTVEVAPDVVDLPAAVEVAAFRIATEAATNAIRHADAEHCRITIRRGAELEIEVADDGTGMTNETSHGVGLTSLRERATELGGRLAIDSVPGRGTTVLACIPIR